MRAKRLEELLEHVCLCGVGRVVRVWQECQRLQENRVHARLRELRHAHREPRNLAHGQGERVAVRVEVAEFLISGFGLLLGTKAQKSRVAVFFLPPTVRRPVTQAIEEEGAVEHQRLGCVYHEEPLRHRVGNVGVQGVGPRVTRLGGVKDAERGCEARDVEAASDHAQARQGLRAVGGCKEGRREGGGGGGGGEVSQRGQAALGKVEHDRAPHVLLHGRHV
mmetsp:Transcript_15539/g.39683  ORF Transcript_15539/g.39683 Transcript_15539/m.39683 type:complete len:221 (+) Transcript_15539:2755-3417(+)